MRKMDLTLKLWVVSFGGQAKLISLVIDTLRPLGGSRSKRDRRS